MAVKLRARESGIVIPLKVKASTTINKDTFVSIDANGDALEAVAAATKVQYVANETVTAGASGTVYCNCSVLSESVLMEIDTATNTAQTNIGKTYDLTNSATVNLAAQTTNVVTVVGLVGAPATRKVLAIVTR